MMRLTVVVPDDAHRQSAGVRIRYGRLAAPLADRGISLVVESIDQVAFGEHGRTNAYLFSKCLDARALVAAHGLRRGGAHVGIDVFDDYISQTDDSRLLPIRAWTEAMLPLTTFVVCSTPVLRAAVLSVQPDVATTLIADPAPDRAGAAPAPAAARATSFGADGVVDFCWFGLGDNPFFPVGLQDLAAFGPILSRVRAHGLEPRLTVLTNRRAFDASTLSALVRLPFAVRVEDWSEARQAALLARVDAAFLPVNGQPFSRAKSLNRALTALSAGTEVLTVGHPLYADLGALLHTDVDSLIEALRAGRPRNSAERRARVLATIAPLADPDAIAADFAGFMSALPDAAPASDLAAHVAVVHGHGTTGQVHKFVRKLGYLSIGSPFTHVPLAFDVSWPAPDGAPELRLSERARAAAREEWRARLTPVEEEGAKRHYRIPLADVLGAAAAHLPAAVGPDQSVRAAAYARGQAAVATAARRLFAPVALYLSETTAPCWAGPAGLGEATAAGDDAR